MIALASSRVRDDALAGSRVLRVAVPGGDLVVEVAGPRESGSPAILLLHGWTLDRRQWRAQAALASRFTLVAIDRRGFGQSTAPPDLAEEPADVARVAAALGLARYHLVGLSQGGKVALAHAATRPPGLDRLVVIGAPLDIAVPEPADTLPLAAMAALAAEGRTDAMRQLWLDHPLMAARPDVRAALAAMLARYEGRDLVAPGRPLPVTLADVQRITALAAALVGRHDTPWRRAVAAALHRAGFAGGVIDGGHLAPLEAPDSANAALIAALS